MSTALRTYSRGDELITLDEEVPHASRVYHFDHQGTTQCLTDGAGAVTDRFASDVWGTPVKRLGSSANPFWYGANLGYYATSRGTGPLYSRSYLDSRRGRTLRRGAALPGAAANGAYQLLYPPIITALLASDQDIQLSFINSFARAKDCGAAARGVYFRMAPPKHPAGLIIQKVDAFANVLDCPPCPGAAPKKVIHPTIEGGGKVYPFWETQDNLGWLIKENKEYSDATLEKMQLNAEGLSLTITDDQFSVEPSLDNTRGTVVLTGIATFYAGRLTVPNGFEQNNERTNAGSFFSSTADPKLGGGPSATQQLIVSWNCCPDSPSKMSTVKCIPPCPVVSGGFSGENG